MTSFSRFRPFGARLCLALLLIPGVGALACGGEPSGGGGAPVAGDGREGTGQAAPVSAGGTGDAPTVVATDPPNGATDVDPARRTLSVTFDREMDRQGWAWVVEDDATAPDVSNTRFGPSGRTATADVDLEPGREYVVWINSESYPYFKGTTGTPAVPFRWSFRTARGPRLLSAHTSGAPRVVELDPPNGATGVDPERSFLRVTFDRPMEGSWAWVREPGTTPPPSTGDPRFESDQRTHELPVDLEPQTTYTIWLNSQDHLLFRDTAGRALEPLRWSFTTGPGGS